PDALFLALPASVARELSGDPEERIGHEELVGVPLGGEGEPFTSIIYFIRARYERVLTDRAAWTRELGENRETIALEGPLVRLLDALEPACIPGWKALYVATDADWTAVFGQGSDLSYVSHYAKRLGTIVVRTSYSPHVVRDGVIKQYGDTAWWMTDGSRADLAPSYGL